MPTQSQHSRPGGKQAALSRPQAALRPAAPHQAHSCRHQQAHGHSAHAEGRHKAHIRFQGKALCKAKHGPIHAAQRQQHPCQRAGHPYQTRSGGLNTLSRGRPGHMGLLFPLTHGAPPSHARCTATGRGTAAAAYAAGCPAARAAPAGGAENPSGHPPPVKAPPVSFRRQR